MRSCPKRAILGAMNQHGQTQVSRIGHRAHRCTPFLVVAVCFFLPFFTLSSCGSGHHTTATGVDIVAGSTLIRQQDAQPLFATYPQQLGPVGPDTQAMAASRAARPWAICLLVLLTVGAIAAVLVDRRGVLATIAALSFVVLCLLLGSASGEPSSDDLKIEAGAWAALLTLLATTLWYAGAALAVSSSRERLDQDSPVTSDHPTSGPSHSRESPLTQSRARNTPVDTATAAPRACSTCGRDVQGTSAFCSSCGARVRPRGVAHAVVRRDQLSPDTRTKVHMRCGDDCPCAEPCTAWYELEIESWIPGHGISTYDRRWVCTGLAPEQYEEGDCATPGG